MLTLKQFRELTKDLPDDMEINTTIEFGNPVTIRGTIDRIHIVPKKHSYAKEGYITLTQKSLDDENEGIAVKTWTGKNEGKTE